MSGPVVLLLEDTQGGATAVRFASATEARDWEDNHPQVVAIGLASLTTRTAALRDRRAG